MGNTNIAKRAREDADCKVNKWKSPDDLRWGYGRDRGPENWWVYYPNAAGHHQSPIDINPEEAEFDSDLVTYPLVICYSRSEAKLLHNTGHGLQVTIEEERPRSYIMSGPVKNEKYSLRQFHLHWGERDDCGSEHTIHKKAFAGEVHFVHWKSSEFSDISQAAEAEGGLAVMAVLLQLSNTKNPFIDYLMRFISDIRYKDQGTNISSDFDMTGLLPRDVGKYWAYKGSLTTPPCNESVTWILFYEPITITASQLTSLRKLLSYRSSEKKPMDEFNGQICKNYRPIQPQGTRKVYTMEHTFMESRDFDEQFKDQALFTTDAEFVCQFHRQGLK